MFKKNKMFNFFKNNNKYNRRFEACKIVYSTLVQPSIRRLFNRRFDASTIVDATLTQPSVRRLDNRQIKACVTVDLMLNFKL